MNVYDNYIKHILYQHWRAMESDGNQVQSSNNIDQAEMIISLKNKVR